MITNDIFQVSEVRDYLANEKIHTEKELYDISCQFEPGLPRRHSEADKSLVSRPVPQFKSSSVGRMAGKRSMSLETATAPDSTCWRHKRSTKRMVMPIYIKWTQMFMEDCNLL